ncbi:chromatin-remodeling complex subunit ies6, partial [Elasticomyces elasticus]
DLSRLVLEKNQKAAQTGPSVTYTSIAAAPSTRPKKRYCDITGLPAPYRDSKTGLYYHNKEVYAVIRGLSTAQIQEYLALRGAATVLK